MKDEETISIIEDQLARLGDLADEINENLKALGAPLADHFLRTIEKQIKEIQRQLEEEL